MATDEEKRAPMASAPMKYLPDGSVDWGTMWESYCLLAQDGGPPHRETLLTAPPHPDTESEGYRYATQEITRGIREVTGLTANPVAPGWLAVQCDSPEMARWVGEAILQENVEARVEGSAVWVPLGDTFTLKGEIKNVITAVAKTTHYWIEHLPPEVKQTLAMQERLGQWKERLTAWLRRAPA